MRTRAILRWRKCYSWPKLWWDSNWVPEVSQWCLVMVTFARWNGEKIWTLGQTLELFVEAPKKSGWMWMVDDDGWWTCGRRLQLLLAGNLSVVFNHVPVSNWLKKNMCIVTGVIHGCPIYKPVEQQGSSMVTIPNIHWDYNGTAYTRICVFRLILSRHLR